MQPAKIGDLETVFRSVLKVSISVVGILSLIMLVVGGFSYIGAGGDKQAVEKAKNTLTFAIAGLILAVSSWMIINILNEFLGLRGFTLTNFSICLPGYGGTDCN